MIRFAFAFGLLVSSNALAQNPPSDDPILCVDTLDCGGICGTEQEVNVFLAQCNGGPAGPCFDDCWSACNHANENNNNPNTTTTPTTTHTIPTTTTTREPPHRERNATAPPTTTTVCTRDTTTPASAHQNIRHPYGERR